MADNKKYYYLKLKENFYDSEEMIILQNMQDGYLYSDILMKLYLRSLKNEGKLMFKDTIPYNPQVLSQVVRHSVGVVEKALKIFRELEMVEILDNGAIYMLDIQNFIGESSTEADRIRIYRNKIDTIKTKDVQMYGKSTPELEIEIELKKEIEKEKKNTYGTYNRIKLTENDYQKLVSELGQSKLDKQIELLDEYIESNNNKNKYSNFNLVLRKSIRENWFEKSTKPVKKSANNIIENNYDYDELERLEKEHIKKQIAKIQRKGEI